MDLDKAWGELGRGPVEGELKAPTTDLGEVKSTHPLVAVRKSLYATNVSGILISIGYILLMIFYPYWQVLIGFAVVLTFNLVFIVQGIRLRNRIPVSVDPSHSMLQEMKLHHEALWKWINNQMYAARFVFPVAAATGFMLGGVWGSGKSIAQLFSKPVFPISMVISMVLFSLAGIWLANMLFSISYKKHLDRLQVNINQLENQMSSEIS